MNLPTGNVQRAAINRKHLTPDLRLIIDKDLLILQPKN